METAFTSSRRETYTAAATPSTPDSILNDQITEKVTKKKRTVVWCQLPLARALGCGCSAGHLVRVVVPSAYVPEKMGRASETEWVKSVAAMVRLGQGQRIPPFL